MRARKQREGIERRRSRVFSDYRELFPQNKLLQNFAFGVKLNYEKNAADLIAK
jgi:ABC-type Fe3+/spermidine/putrescine transport system ATPase subunit